MANLRSCTYCSREISSSARFCEFCGADLNSISQKQTFSSITAVVSPHKSSSPVGRIAFSEPAETGGFAPGEILTERFRIIGLLGRGGMGEVYRADDLKLGQAVALKFLPAELAGDEQRKERFFREVRIARQVSHPNVCRVYDVLETNGRQFLTMEYVDGEDLSSLLRRIGRLPPDKALDIARQLVAGLAAAHDRGVLHRDLKPANVMIDGRGRARIMDFGLAVALEKLGEEQEICGTLAYMAPEQLTGQGASIQTDIYALGLVIYELYTGRRAYTGDKLAELLNQKQETAPQAPSQITSEIDPAIERLILRCVERDPVLRPASALEVASVLPGGDPLAAAIAGGETPSPEMVAASGRKGTLTRAQAWSLVASICGLVAIWIISFHRIYANSQVLFSKPPEVLAEKAREVIGELGYPVPPGDSWYAFEYDLSPLSYFREQGRANEIQQILTSNNLPIVLFVYRDSPRPLVTQNHFGIVTSDDPPVDIPGMRTLILTSDGQLRLFSSVPPQMDSSPSEDMKMNWVSAFGRTGLDMQGFSSTTPEWMPPVGFDTRVAWKGSFLGPSHVPLRIEASAYRGKLTYLNCIGPWKKPLEQSLGESRQEKIIATARVCLTFGTLIVGVILARHNLRLKRGDRKGAAKIAFAGFALIFLAWICFAHHVNDPAELRIIAGGLSRSLYWAAFIWIIYVALEPLVRRRMPQTLVSWTRLLAGHFTDPLVGRDVFVGILLGVLHSVVLALGILIPELAGFPNQVPFTVSIDSMSSSRAAAGNFFDLMYTSLFYAVDGLFLLLILKMILRRKVLAGVAWVVLVSAFELTGGGSFYIELVGAIVAAAVFYFALERFGVLTLAVSLWTYYLTTMIPITLDTTSWYFGRSAAVLISILALTVYAYRTALGKPAAKHTVPAMANG